MARKRRDRRDAGGSPASGSAPAFGLDPADPRLVDPEMVGDLVEEGALDGAGPGDGVRVGSLVGEAVEGDPAWDGDVRRSPGGPGHALVEPEQEDPRSLLVGPRLVLGDDGHGVELVGERSGDALEGPADHRVELVPAALERILLGGGGRPHGG